jgi:signal transduction histidine kinase
VLTQVVAGPPRTRAAAPAAGLVATALALAVAALVVDALNSGTAAPPDAGLDPGWPTTLTGLAQLLPGALLLRRLPRHVVAWTLVVSGTVAVLDGLAAAWARYAVYTAPGAPGASAAYWFYQRFGAVLLLALPVLLLVFPHGRLPARPLARRLALASLAATALLPLVLAVVPHAAASRLHGERTPPEIAALALDPLRLDLPYAVWEVALPLAYALALAGLVVPVAVVVGRYRRARGASRQQLRWVVWAGVVDLLALLAAGGLGLPPLVGSLLLTASVALTSAAVVVAVTRHRLYDIDELLSATVVYGLLAVLVVLVDVAVVALAGRVLGERDSALVALGAVALVYAPLRHRLWAGVRRAVRGSRDDPYGAVSTLAERLELAEDPDQQLRAVARSVAEAFRLPWVRVEVERPGGERAHVEHGHPTGTPVELPVVYRGEAIGRVLLCTAGRAGLSERDQRLFGDLVRQAAAAARASELSASLQRIRERLVLAREEERRRLRRDLHDSLGPGLGAVTLRIETARNLAVTAPAEADRMLERATADVAAALADVRRLVHDLRPPALDELGLLHAVRQQADRLSTDGLAITVTGEGGLGDLPAAVEVAAYRIAAEAMTNVVRHAGARHCSVSLRVGSAGPASVEVVVRDDGIGIGPDVVAGVGTLSLRERAGELGGTCTVGCPPGGGTEVRAVLPIGGAP